MSDPENSNEIGDKSIKVERNFFIVSHIALLILKCQFDKELITPKQAGVFFLPRVNIFMGVILGVKIIKTKALKSRELAAFR